MKTIICLWCLVVGAWVGIKLSDKTKAGKQAEKINQMLECYKRQIMIHDMICQSGNKELCAIYTPYDCEKRPEVN